MLKSRRKDKFRSSEKYSFILFFLLCDHKFIKEQSLMSYPSKTGMTKHLKLSNKIDDFWQTLENSLFCS